MTKNEYNAIKCIVDREIENDNLKEINDLKKYINMKIYEHQKYLFIQNENIIYERLLSFIENNFYGIEKDDLKIDLLFDAIREIKGVDDIYVGDLIDININDITSSRYYCGEQTINQLNNALKKYGFSIYDELDEEQINELENIRNEKELELK